MLNEDKKQFIFYPYINKRKSANPNENYPSMEALKSAVEKLTNKIGECCNKKTDDITLEGLEDVNKTWSELDFIIVNQKITLNINYEMKDFI